MQKHALIGLIAGLAAASIWGGMYVVSKVVLEVIPLCSAYQSSGPGCAGFVCCDLFSQLEPGEEVTFSRRQTWESFLVGAVGYGISLGFQFVGTKLSTASNRSLVTSATPILGEKTTVRKVVALLISTAGVVAVIDPRNAELSPSLFWGNFSLLAAALTWALFSVLVRKVAQTADLLTSSSIMLAGGIPSSILFRAWEVQTQGIGRITIGIIGGILFLGIISTAIAMFLWNYAFAELPAAVASLTFFAQPVVGSLLGWWLLGENITSLFLLGGLLIGVGLVISSTDKNSPSAAG